MAERGTLCHRPPASSQWRPRPARANPTAHYRFTTDCASQETWRSARGVSGPRASSTCCRRTCQRSRQRARGPGPPSTLTSSRGKRQTSVVIQEHPSRVASYERCSPSPHSLSYVASRRTHSGLGAYRRRFETSFRDGTSLSTLETFTTPCRVRCGSFRHTVGRRPSHLSTRTVWKLAGSCSKCWQRIRRPDERKSSCSYF